MTDLVLPAADLLTAEDEIELARRMEAGVLAEGVLAGDLDPVAATTEELRLLAAEGRAARDRYVIANVRLVAMVANPAARRSGLGLGDLFQEGVGGLLQAVDRFDHRQRVRFATYALPWIRAQVARAVANRCGALPLSGHRAERRRSIHVVAQRMGQRLGREATSAEVARELGVGTAGVAELLAVEVPVALVDENGAVIDPPDPRAGRALEQVGIRPPAVGEWLAQLPPTESRVVSLRFGFDGAPHSYAGAAVALGVSKSTVRRLEVRALDRLRGMCSTEHLPLAG